MIAKSEKKYQTPARLYRSPGARLPCPVAVIGQGAVHHDKRLASPLSHIRHAVAVDLEHAHALLSPMCVELVRDFDRCAKLAKQFYAAFLVGSDFVRMAMRSL
jgi:hypothetical protein